jgi:hypothetical protein
MTKTSTSAKAAFKTKKSKINIDVTTVPNDTLDVFTSNIPLAPPGYECVSMTLSGTLSVTYQLISLPVLDKMMTICKELARVLKVPSSDDISIIPIKMEEAHEEAHVCDDAGNEVFAVRRRKCDTYDVVLFSRVQNKCRHTEPVVTKAQRKAAPASVWSCVKPGQIDGVSLKDNKVVCSLFRTHERTEAYDRMTELFSGGDEDVLKSLEDIISERNKPMYCTKNDCMTLFCGEH